MQTRMNDTAPWKTMPRSLNIKTFCEGFAQAHRLRDVTDTRLVSLPTYRVIRQRDV